jgi:hypothetical protein
MKIIQYTLDGLKKTITWSEANELVAAGEADNGEYSILDDGQPQPETQPTEEERLAELEEALDLLLSGVTQ